jgi:hypothetical protein
MRPHLKVLNLRLSLLLAIVTIVVLWLISRSTKDFQPEKASGNFHSVDLLKRADEVVVSRAGTTEDRPVTTDQEGLNMETWERLVDKGEKLISNMRRTAGDLAKQSGMNGNSESTFQVSMYPFNLKATWLT